METGGYVNFSSEFMIPVICFQCGKRLGKEEYIRGEHTIYLCDDCQKPLTDATEKVQNMTPGQIRDRFEKVLSELKLKLKKEE